jgi:hypothetical protein
MYMGVFLAAMGGLLIFRTWAIAVFVPMCAIHYKLPMLFE